MEDPRKSIVRRYIEEVVNTGNVDRVCEFIAPADVETAKDHIRGVRSTYADLHVTVGDQVAEGDLVATYVVATGIHQGRFCGIEPTNRPIRISGVNLDRIRDGKIVEHRGGANTLEALFEIGALAYPRED